MCHVSTLMNPTNIMLNIFVYIQYTTTNKSFLMCKKFLVKFTHIHTCSKIGKVSMGVKNDKFWETVCLKESKWNVIGEGHKEKFGYIPNVSP